ncbi:putative leucine-rich repeat receptor-like serine/threonine-protein kinase At2g19230 isoform X2 [Lolium perenne]|nr:putative leucine-rich repeat receptor-like protein kinase At2g19210 isoform X2 [Lolium perenne]
MMTIQTEFSVKRNWAGDPCVPISFAWNGLNCSYIGRSPPRIIALNMSSSGLVGEIDLFGNIMELERLDLSHNNLSGSIPYSQGREMTPTFLDLSYNNLSGSIPDYLGQGSPLTFLDLSHNKLSGSIPLSLGLEPTFTFLFFISNRDFSSNDLSGSIPCHLLVRSQLGSLTLRVDDNPNLRGDNTCNDVRKNKDNIKPVFEIVALVVAAVLVLFVAVFVLIVLRRSKKRAVLMVPPDVAHSSNPLENRRFSYKELKCITNNFRTVVGKGGFGLVYLGSLENGTHVAVKMRSETSSQGNAEFLAEAQHLARVHHKNLVSLIGYCKDNKHLSLVYEYMDGGNLQERLAGQEPLNWQQRLKIALDSAYGLEYLHKSCSPPLIHRDVKTGNILLTANLEAKLSDFGLTRAFSSETMTHTTTQPAGTLGYLDPEYYATYHLSEKSDVYSFGVVLLVLITGQPAIINISDTERTNIPLWARRMLSEGDIDSVTDPTIREDCDINSVWKVVEVALQCTEREVRDRPTMGEVVEGIGESLQLETLSRSMRCSSIRTGSSAFADSEPGGTLEAAELVGETSAR